MHRAQTWPRWRRAAARITAGQLLVTALVLVVIALVAGRQALRVKPVRIDRQVAGAPAPYVDAAGCPVTVRCRVGDTAPPAMVAALHRALPTSRLVSVIGVYDSSSGQPYRITLTAQLDAHSTLRLLAQRLPGSPANDQAQEADSTRDHDDLAGNSVVDERSVVTMVPGPAGSMLELLLDSVTDQYRAAVAQLSHDRDAQLQP